MIIIMPKLLTPEKKKIRENATLTKATAYIRLQTLLLDGILSPSEALQWVAAIKSCRSLADIDGIQGVLDSIRK
jgi:hypothetical protein